MTTHHKQSSDDDIEQYIKSLGEDLDELTREFDQEDETIHTIQVLLDRAKQRPDIYSPKRDFLSKWAREPEGVHVSKVRPITPSPSSLVRRLDHEDDLAATTTWKSSVRLPNGFTRVHDDYQEPASPSFAFTPTAGFGSKRPRGEENPQLFQNIVPDLDASIEKDGSFLDLQHHVEHEQSPKSEEYSTRYLLQVMQQTIARQEDWIRHLEEEKEELKQEVQLLRQYVREHGHTPPLRNVSSTSSFVLNDLDDTKRNLGKSPGSQFVQDLAKLIDLQPAYCETLTKIMDQYFQKHPTDFEGVM